MRWFTLILIGCVSLQAAGAVINVPADYPTIQAAIDASVNGDEIIVAPGLYVENIVFGGKSITIRSSGGPDVTTIIPDSPGSGPAMTNPGSLVLDSVNNRVLVANNDAFTLYDVDLATGDRTIISDSVTGSGPLIAKNGGVELDTNSNRALAIHRVPNAALYGVNLTTGDRTLISGDGTSAGSGTQFSQIEAVQFDAANNRVLIIDSGLNAIFGVNLATGARTILSSSTVGTGPNTQSARDIEYDPALNRAYVFANLTFTSTPAVYSIDLSTGNRAILSDPTHGTGTNFLFASGIALNVAGNEVFVSDANLRAIISVDLTTGNRTIVSQNDVLGVGINFITPWDIEYDSSNNRILVVDLSLDALIGVDLATGDRTVISRVVNTQTVIIAQGELAGTTLQGFTISGAQINGALRIGNASQPTIRDCVFDDNHANQNGGAISTFNGGNVTIFDCVFTNNTAGNTGGAISVVTSTVSCERCFFAGNTAPFGGGFYNASLASLKNCMFTGNEGSSFGGGIFMDGPSFTTIVNCTIVGNPVGGGVYDISSSSSTITNSIVRGNSPTQITVTTLVVDHCNVEGGIAGSGNIDLPSLFTDADGPDNIAGTLDDDFSLLASSPDIDAGNNDVFDACALDLAGNDRRVDDPATTDTGSGFGTPVDMGAYEFGSSFFDCNTNGILDSCEALDFSETSSLLTPIGEGAPQVKTFLSVPLAGVAGATLIFEATGDFADPLEFIDVFLNGIPVGSVFVSGASDCPTSPDLAQLVIPAATFNPSVGAGIASITMAPAASVAANPIGCTSSITVRLVYQAVTVDDANGDGVPDVCVCVGDTNTDGSVNVTDLLALLAAWGSNPGHVADFNDDGNVNVTDLLALLAAWGTCP